MCSGPDPAATADLMNQQLALIHDWLVEHRMRLNVQKSRIMWFRAGRCKLQHPYPHVSINGVTLQTTERQTYLGLSFDACFSWDSQVSNICKKMSYYLYLIKSHCKVLKFDIMKLLIESLVFSHLTYAMSVWGSSLKQHLVGHLERLQNRAVCLLFHLHKYDHITGYYHCVGWLPLSQLIKYHSLCTMFHQFRCDGKGIPLEPPIQFGRLTNHHTRTKYFFSHPERCRLSFTQFFFHCKATHWWNMLPSIIKSHVQLNDFKNDLKTHFLS